MSHRTIRSTLVTSSLIVAAFASGAAQAALIDRGGGLIYDTDLNVTWLQNANAALGSSYDSADGSTDGRMTWQNAVDWAANLSYFDSVRNVTYTDWRLPTITDTGAPGCDWSNSGTDCGVNVDTASSEMAHLYHTELGNLSFATVTGDWSGAVEGGSNPDSALDKVGPFTNLQSQFYWSEDAYYGVGTNPWAFDFYGGSQSTYELTNSFHALAVRPGDVGAVPEAQTYALMLAGLGLVGWRARRRG